MPKIIRFPKERAPKPKKEKPKGIKVRRLPLFKKRPQIFYNRKEITQAHIRQMIPELKEVMEWLKEEMDKSRKGKKPLRVSRLLVENLKKKCDMINDLRMDLERIKETLKFQIKKGRGPNQEEEQEIYRQIFGRLNASDSFLDPERLFGETDLSEVIKKANAVLGLMQKMGVQ